MKFIGRQFCRASKYLAKELLIPFFVLYALFIIVCLLAYIVTKFIPEEYVNMAMGDVETMLSETGVMEQTGIGLFLTLFLNNSRVGIISFLTGFIPFFFIPAGILVFNAAVVGVVIGASEMLSGVNAILIVILTILPHGIFEITAIVLSTAAGARLCIALCKKIFRKGKDEKIMYHIKRYIGVLVIYITPLLLIAAFIEGVVLPWLMSLADSIV